MKIEGKPVPITHFIEQEFPLRPGNLCLLYNPVPLTD